MSHYQLDHGVGSRLVRVLSRDSHHVVVTAIMSSRRRYDSAARNEDHWTSPETNPSFGNSLLEKNF
jgi:hypothetical protein